MCQRIILLGFLLVACHYALRDANFLTFFLEPIFHCELGSRWVTNANEMSTKNMKCAWPTRKFCIGDPLNLYSTDSRWGFALGVTQILGLALGETQILAFLDTNMLVSPMRNCDIGGLSQSQDPTRMVLRRSGI